AWQWRAKTTSPRATLASFAVNAPRNGSPRRADAHAESSPASTARAAVARLAAAEAATERLPRRRSAPTDRAAAAPFPEPLRLRSFAPRLIAHPVVPPSRRAAVHA